MNSIYELYIDIICVTLESSIRGSRESAFNCYFYLIFFTTINTSFVLQNVTKYKCQRTFFFQLNLTFFLLLSHPPDFSSDSFTDLFCNLHRRRFWCKFSVSIMLLKLDGNLKNCAHGTNTFLFELFKTFDQIDCTYIGLKLRNRCALNEYFFV